MMKPKKFDFLSMILLGINSVIGSGIFLMPGKIMSLTGPLSLFVYLFVTFLVISIALCFAKCATVFNRNGAAYLYAKEAFGEFVAFEVGFMKWVVSIIGWAALVVGFVTGLSAVWPIFKDPFWHVSTIILILSGSAFLNIFGLSSIRFLNNILTVAKLIPLLFIVGIGIFFMDGNHFSTMFQQKWQLDAFGEASLIIFFAFSGFETLAVVAQDMENPEKNVPVALILVILTCATLYFLLQVVAIGVLGPSLAFSISPVMDISEQLFGLSGKWLVVAASLISMAGINVVASFVCPKTAVVLAEDRLIPIQIAKNNRFGAPYIAIILTTGLTLACALMGNFFQLVAISMVARFVQYLPTCLAVLVLHGKSKFQKTGRGIFVVVVPLIAIVFSLLLLFHITSEQLIYGLGALFVGIPIYLLMRIKKSKEVSHFFDRFDAENM